MSSNWKYSSFHLCISNIHNGHKQLLFGQTLFWSSNVIFFNPFFETGQEPVPITEIECSSKKLEKDANANPKYIFPIVTIQTKVKNIYF